MNAPVKRHSRDLLEYVIRAWVCHLANHEIEALKGGILESRGLRPNGDEIVIPMTREAARVAMHDAVRIKQKTKRAS